MLHKESCPPRRIILSISTAAECLARDKICLRRILVVIFLYFYSYGCDMILFQRPFFTLSKNKSLPTKPCHKYFMNEMSDDRNLLEWLVLGEFGEVWVVCQSWDKQEQCREEKNKVSFHRRVPFFFSLYTLLSWGREIWAKFLRFSPFLPNILANRDSS